MEPGAPPSGGAENSRWPANLVVYTRRKHGKQSSVIADPSVSQLPITSPASPIPSIGGGDVAGNDALSDLPAPISTPALSHPLPPSSHQNPVAAPSPASDGASLSPNRGPAACDPMVPDENIASADPGVAVVDSGYQQQVNDDLSGCIRADLEEVRAMIDILNAKEMEMKIRSEPLIAGATLPDTGYVQSQYSGTDPETPVLENRVIDASFPLTASAAPGLCYGRPPSILIPSATRSIPSARSMPLESLERDKRTPKANMLYSEYFLANDRLPPVDTKKPKSNGAKRHMVIGDVNSASDRKIYSSAFKKCGSLLTKLMKTKCGWVFNEPVDPIALGIHDYFNFIKHPMDLGTIKSRLGKNYYRSPMEFADDVRLTFRNAMTYNPKGHEVHVMAEQLLQMFETHWMVIEHEITSLANVLSPKKTVAPQFEVQTIERLDSTVQNVMNNVTPPVVPYLSYTKRVPALKKPKAKDPHKRPMTSEEKMKLRNNLENLPYDKLEIVIELVKNKNYAVTYNKDDAEIDILSMDPETLWELDRFVSNYKKNLSKRKRRAELAMLARLQTDRNVGVDVIERNPGPVLENGNAPYSPQPQPNVEGPTENIDVSMPDQEEKGETASRSSSSSSSGHSSGSSSSTDSDSDSSSIDEGGRSP